MDYPGEQYMQLQVPLGEAGEIWYRDLIHTEEEAASYPWRQRLERCGQTPRNSSSQQKVEVTRDGFSPRASRAKWPCKHLDFRPVILILDLWLPEL